MHYSTILFAATALCATSASACFSSGANWGDHDVAKGQLASACRELQGFYHVRDHRRICRNSPSDPNKSFVFEVTNESGHDATYAQDACESDIGYEIDHCGHGGKDSKQGWAYRGDPNDDPCS